MTNNYTFREMRQADIIPFVRGAECPNCTCRCSFDIDEPNRRWDWCDIDDCACHDEACSHPASFIEAPDTAHDETAAWCRRCENHVVPTFNEDGFDGYVVWP